jgi:methylmalonyl-CoA mutase
MADNLLADFPAVSPADWKQKIIEELKGKPFADLIWHTQAGFDVHPFYTEQSIQKIKPDIPRKQKPGWEIRQDFVVKDIGESNKLALDALASGAESVGFDVSKVDVAKTNLQRLLKGINLSKQPVHFAGVKMRALEKLVSVFNSKTAGSVALSDFSLNDISAIVQVAVKFPTFGFITLAAKDGNIKALIESGAAILQHCSQSKILLKKILPTIRFSVSLFSDYFMEIAKLRALRFLWTNKVIEFEKVKEVPVFIHAENILQKTPKGEGHYNLLRATTIAMAAITGGCDSLSLKSSAIPGKSKAFSDRIYRNVQLLLKYESSLQQMDDQGSGSYCIESLTKEITNQLGTR